MHGYTPRNVMITGGAGFIGCHFVHYQLESDSRVNLVNLDAMTYASSLESLKDLPDPNRHKLFRGDICDRNFVDQLLHDYEIDTIVHFAAESHVDRSITGPAAFMRTNVTGTFTLLEAARAFWLDEKSWDEHRCRFHHISTDEVFGTLKAQEPAFCETTPYTPNSPYSASKAASDHFVRAYHETYGLPVTVTNCSNNYGPYQHDEKFIPTVIRSCLNSQSIPIYGDGSNMRDWLYVRDHCIGIDRVLRQGQVGESYNIGGRNNWKNLDVVYAICEVLAELTGETEKTFSQLIRFVKDRPGHDWRYAIDTTKIEQTLGWAPQESFESGIRKTIAWYMKKYQLEL